VRTSYRRMTARYLLESGGDDLRRRLAELDPRQVDGYVDLSGLPDLTGL